MKYSILLLSLIMLTACGKKLHPLEEPAKFRLPQVVTSEDLAAAQPVRQVIETETPSDSEKKIETEAPSDPEEEIMIEVVPETKVEVE